MTRAHWAQRTLLARSQSDEAWVDRGVPERGRDGGRARLRVDFAASSTCCGHTSLRRNKNWYCIWCGIYVRVPRPLEVEKERIYTKEESDEEEVEVTVDIELEVEV